MKNYILFWCVLIAACCSFGCSKQKHITDQQSEAKSLSVNTVIPGSPSDTNIRYFGRWDFSNVNQYVSYWGGAYIKVNFTGTTVKIKLGIATNYYYKIDNGPWITLTNVKDTVNLTPVPLAAGTHTLSVAQGKDYSYVFSFRGLLLDEGATTSVPSTGIDLLEFIGDSITAGYTDPQANVSDYAWVCSENLGAEHTQIAFPGITLVDGYGINGTKIGMEVQYFKLQSIAYPSSSNWTFATYTPKLIIINLGQNDVLTSVPDSAFQRAYISFLSNIRAKFLNAHIFAMRPFAGAKQQPIMAAVQAREATGDLKVHYIDTNGWLTLNTSDYTNNSGIHPSVSGHIKAAGYLQAILAPYR